MNYLGAVISSTALPVRRLRFATAFLVSLVLSALSLFAATAGTGSIAGAVTSSKTRNALQGATITLPSLNRSEFSDNSGSFLLQNLPAGPVEVIVSYSGFDEERRTVTVRPGEVTRLDPELKPAQALMMDAFTVATEKEGAALSITEQRNAANIKNVSALDEWGNLPTLSVAELAMRLPGITFVTDEDNVVNNVSIRGQPAGFTRLNVDGMSSTGVGGDGRSATLHSFSGAMYEQIEIIAGQTPDRRADGLGGQLNLKTRSALSMSEKRRFNYNLSARWAPPFAERTAQRADHPIHPVFSLAYQERFDVFGGSRNLGIAVNASYTEGVNMINQDNLFYQSTTNPVAFFNDYTTYTGLNHRFIKGVSIRADYRPSPRTTYSVRFLYNGGSEPFYDRTRIDPIGNGTLAIQAANGALSGTGSIVPGFTENRTEIRPTGVAGNSRMDLEMWRFSFISKNPTGTISGEHDLGRVKLDYAARWSNTHYHSGAGREAQGGQLTMRADNIGFVLDKTDLDGRVFTQTAGPSVYDVNSYRTNIVYTKRDSVNDTNEVAGTINAAYSFGTGIPLTIKAGADTVNRRVNARLVNPRRWNRNVNPAGPAGTMIPLDGSSLMALTRFEEKNGGPSRVPVVDPAYINHELSNTALWTEDLVYASQQPFTTRRLMEEAVDSGYLMGTGRFGRLTVLGGVRVEDVKLDTFTYVKYRATAVAVEPDPFKRALLDYGNATSEGGYTKVFPSIHFAYDITRNLKARASWSTSYGRPTLAQLVAGATFNDQQQTVTAGNPSLEPQLAENIDLKLEYYFQTSGVFTVSLFEKRISDYIVNRGNGTVPSGPGNGFEGDFSGYILTSPSNAGDARVRGWEADYRQRLTFLPGLLKGLTFAANYTWLETTGKFTSTIPIATNDVIGFIPRAANARLLYNYKRFGASAAWNFTGEHIHPLSPLTPEANRLYRRDLTTVNLGVSYKVRPQANVYLDVSNIFEHGPSVYRFIPSRPRQEVHAGMTINVGVSGQF